MNIQEEEIKQTITKIDFTQEEKDLLEKTDDILNDLFWALNGYDSQDDQKQTNKIVIKDLNKLRSCFTSISGCIEQINDLIDSLQIKEN